MHFLYIYLAKDVERGGGDHILHIGDSIWITVPYTLLDFAQTCVVFESLIVLWCGYGPFS